ncbi:MAG: DNA alkylation repair protein [Ignavibacteriae bacterium]|nr:DNA alkylation repair protein [Ignavibacteriota bacterium]
MKTLIPEIQSSLASMPTKNAPSFRLVRREWSKRLKTSTGRSVISMSRQLVSLGVWERLFAYEVLAHHRDASQALRPKDVVALGRGIRSWGEVDCFASYVAGPAWRDGNLPTRVIQGWTRSEDHWWRRVAVVSTVPLNNRARGGEGDAKRTLGICRLVVRDRHDMVVKALSWALRELSKRDTLAVRTFLDHYSQQLAPRVLREVQNKIRTGLKNPRAR